MIDVTIIANDLVEILINVFQIKFISSCNVENCEHL